MNYNLLAEELLESMVIAARQPFHRDPAEFAKGEISILNHLYLNRDGVSSGQLSEKVGLGSGRIADALKSLEAKQYIVRRGDPGDRRKVIVYITNRGSELVDRKKELLQQTLCKNLMQLGEEDAKEFVRLMGRIARLNTCQQEE